MRYQKLIALCLMLILQAAGAFCCYAADARSIVVSGLYSISEAELFELLGTGGWDSLDAEAVQRSIRTAFLKGIFEDIAITVPEAGGPIEVRVKERDLISRISIAGEYRISEKQLRSLFLLKEGDQFRHDLAGRAVSGLQAELLRMGFPAAEVRYEVRSAGQPYRIHLELQVSAGPPEVIRSINFIFPPGGASVLPPDIRLMDLISLSVGDVFVRDTVETGIKKIRTFLKSRGYVKPAAGPYRYSNGDLDIPLDPGKRLSVLLQGNVVISSRLLLKESLLSEVEDFNDEVVGEAVDRMKMYYHSLGYNFVQIAPVMKSGDRDITLSFFIYEGEQVRVGTISFSSADILPEVMKQVMTLKENSYFNPESIDKDRDLLKEFFVALGYLEASVKTIEPKLSADRKTADLHVVVEKGERTELAGIVITGASEERLRDLHAIARIKKGDPYNEVDISDARFRMLELYNSLGYPAVGISVQRQIENHKAEVVFTVSEGEKRLVGRTVITGNVRTAYQVIRRELLHKEGQVLNLGLLAEERQRLYKLGLFNDVEISAVDLTGGRSDLIVKVNEGNAGSVEFGAGYAEYEKFRGFVEVSYRNLWGMNREGLLRAEISSLERRLVLQYNEPWFLSRQLPLRVSFQYNKKQEFNATAKETLYRLTRYSISAGIERKLSNEVKSEINYEFSLVSTTDVRPDVILTKEDVGTLAISGIKPVIVYDTRDNPFNPENGVVAGASIKFASSVLLSETNFAKLEVYGSRFQKLARGLVLAASGRGGVAYHLGDTQELPLVERFFLGGRSTVRGFEQDTLGPKGSDNNPTGGNVFVMGNIELRTALGGGFGLVPFFDFGNVWVNTKKLHLSDLRYTSGLGLRYNTPVGPLRVDYGYKLNREAGESKGALHFSVGHAF